MTNRSEPFGRLLKGAINAIAAYEGKSAPVIEDELGAQVGLSGAAIQRYKAGYLPPEPRAIAILAEAAVRRGFLARPWLARFLSAARYPTPETLLGQLADALGAGLAPSHDGGLPTGTVALLFTDIAGSTRRWEEQPRAMERDLARHDAILRQAIDAYGGTVFKTVGDAFYAVFTTVPAALEAALAAQRALLAEAWGPSEPISVRMAIHVGAPQQREGDYFGPPLNRIARILAAGHGGQLLLSLSAQELAHELLPPGVTLRDLGEQRLKDFGRPERVFQAVAPGLPNSFPALRGLDSYRHNLPPQVTALVGREREVEQVLECLHRDETRLLTLTGPGGIGKTRLALQTAAEALDDYPDGVSFVALAPVRDAQLVILAIAQALGLKEAADTPVVQQVIAALKPRRALLVLDNCEQVLDAAPVIGEILAAAPQVKALATSREALHLYGEQEYPVPPLDLPEPSRLMPIERLAQVEAVRLFIERARAVRPDLAVTDETAPLIAEICARLDGLPLAIELAAARSKLFPPKALLARLDKRLKMLTGGPRDLPARQQTLAGAIAWSYDLLDATEQALFARLGVFSGGCTIEAAEAVLGDDGADDAVSAYVPSGGVLNGLSALVDRSLLRQAEGVGGEPRFMMLETIREFALERLATNSEEEVLRRRHADYFAALLPQRSVAGYQINWLQLMSQEHDNLRGALSWAIASDTAEPALKIGCEFFFWENYQAEARKWLRAMLTLPSAAAPSMARFWARYSEGTIARDQNDNLAAREAFNECLAISEQLGWWSYVTHWSLAWCDMAEGDFANALAIFDALLADTVHPRPEPVQQSQGWLCYGAAAAACQLGDTARAEALITESVAAFKAHGDPLPIAKSLNKLGYILRHAGELGRSREVLTDALEQTHAAGMTRDLTNSFSGLAGLAQLEHNSLRAARLFGAAAALKQLTGAMLSVDDGPSDARLMDAARAALGDEAFEAAWQAGGAMTLEEAVTLALEKGA